jgi:hypothetical protein
MKALKITLIVVSSLLLVGGAGYLYAASGIKSKLGYSKLVTPTLVTQQGEAITALLSVNLGPSGLKPARWLLELVAEHSGSEHQIPKRVLNNVMQELQGVQLRVYEVGSNRHVFDKAIADSISGLKERNWLSLATVRENDVKVAVLQYLEGEQIEGLSIMASTPDKAIFLNLIGPFDLEMIAETAQ